MQIGVVFPQNEIGTDVSVVRDFAQTAEALGYTHLLIYDHVLGAVRDDSRRPFFYSPYAGPYSEESQFHEPFVLFGYLAGMTQKLGLVTGVLVLPQRQTALVAKQTAEIDLLSGGRLRLGVGTGWNHVEYQALGMDFDARGAMQEEQVELLRKLWTEPLLDYSGQFHRVDRAGLRPLLERPVPIWFGGYVEAVIDRTARVGDGFIFGHWRADTLDVMRRIRERAAEVGRDPASLGFEVVTWFREGPDRWGPILEGWRDAGGTHLSLNTMSGGLEHPRDHIKAIERYAEVAAPFRTPAP